MTPLFDRAELEPERSDELLVPVRHSVVFGPEGRGTGENAAERKERLRLLSWEKFSGDVIAAIHARLELLSGRSLDEVITCPWSRVVTCTAECRCEGTGTITVIVMVQHYRQMLTYMGYVAPKKPRQQGRRRRYAFRG